MIRQNVIPIVATNPNPDPAKKKKRKNKKKKNAKKVVEESSSDSDDSDIENFTFMTSTQFQSKTTSKPKPPSVGAYHTNQLDDPVTVTIKQVVSKSHYNHDRVASCVNRMWDTGLQYDSPEAVLAELQREDDKKVEEQDDYDEILDGKRVGIDPPVPSLPPPVQVQTSQSSTKVKGAGEQPTFAKPPAIPSISFGRHTISPVPPSQTAPSAPKQEQPPQQALSLSARLEVIASHDDINQALIALNSWCQVTPNASLSFFQHDCYAIEIILQKFCAVPSLIHESSIRGQLSTLLTQLLPPPALKSSAPRSDHIHTMINAFSTLLDQAACSTSLKISTPLTSSNNNTPSQTSRLSPLALRLGQSLRKTHQTYEKTRATFSDSDSIFVIEDEINDLTNAIKKLQASLATSSTAAPAGGSAPGAAASAMKEKFELRELISEVFQLHLKKLDAIQQQKAKSSTTPTDFHLPPTISYSQQDNFALENAILLASGDSRRNIDALKLQATSSKSYYEKLFHDHETRLVPYQKDLMKLNLQYSENEMKKNKLLQEISEIDLEMTHIANKTETIKIFLNELQEQHDHQIQTLNTSHGNVVEALEKDKQINQLFIDLKNLELVMEEVSTVGILHGMTAAAATTGGGVGVGGGSHEILLETFVSYSEIETKCVEFLTKRILLMKEKILYSQREVTEYQNLGMSNLAAEITLSIERMKENIAEDLCALESLQNTVCEMLTSLHSTIRNHSVVRAMPSHSLQEIAANLRAAGVTLRPELAPYNTPIAPPPGLNPHPVAAPAAEPTSHASEPKAPSAPVAPAAPTRATAAKTKPQTNEKPKQTEKPKAAAEKKSSDRTEKKVNEKQHQQQIGEKKLSKTNPQPASISAVQTAAPDKEKKPSKESPKANTKSGPVPVPVAAPTVEPLPQRTNSKRKQTPTASVPSAATAAAVNGTPQKAPQGTQKPTVPVTPPPGFTKGSGDSKPSWTGWAPLPATKTKSGSLAQIQAEQASAKKAREASHPVATAPPSAEEFPHLKEEVAPPSQPEKKPEAESNRTDAVSPSPGDEESKTVSTPLKLNPTEEATEDEDDNPDARSDISIRGNDDDLDDDDDEEEVREQKTGEVKAHPVAVVPEPEKTDEVVATPVTAVEQSSAQEDEPVADVAPVATDAAVDPVAESPAVDPVAESPAVDPVAESPAVDPVAESPAVDPVAESPAVDPVAESPAVDATAATEAAAAPENVEDELINSSNTKFDY